MKAVIVRAIAATLLFGASWISWTAGQLQARLTEASRQALMLRYSGSLGEYDEIEQSLGYVGRLPSTTNNMLAELHERRATAQYWDSLYGTLPLARDASGDAIEKDPGVLFLAANASYRAAQRADGDRLAAVRALDAVISNYAEVIRKNPGHADAAYNYEYAVRARDAVARSRETSRPKPGGPLTAPDDLPAGPTIDGHPGAPPRDTDMKKFKVLAPMRPDEREAAPDKAGDNKRPLRKG